MLSFIAVVFLILVIAKWFGFLFPSKPKPLSCVVLDFETANSSKHSICQVGMVVVKNNEIVDSFSCFVKPPSSHFSDDNTAIHGITYDMVKNASTFDVIWPKIKNQIADTGIVAAHYALFDVSALCATLNHYKIPLPKFSVVDSCITTRTVWPQLQNHKLITVSEYLNIELNHHDALSDATACAKILIEATKGMGKKLLKLHPNDCINSREYKKIFDDVAVKLAI